MRRVALHDDGAAGGERRRGVAAGGAEREWEVARAEDGHRADRDEHAPDVGAREGARVGVGGVDDRVDVVPRLDDRAERLDLTPRPLELAADARLGEPALGYADGDDLLGRAAQ